MKLRFFVFASAIILPYFIQAKVFINEIAWMGSLPKGEETSAQAANNEWIELYNDGEKSIDLTGWTLAAEDGTPTIILEKVIQADSYFLLERTDDDSVSGIEADKIYAGALGNSGEILFLKDSNNIVIDKISSPDEWLWGNNTTKETMQRVGDNWVTANPTPKAANKGVVQNVQTADNKSNSGEDELPIIPNSQATSPIVIPNIKPYAGEDKTAVVGSPVEFRGFALGLNNEPIDKARFWWNFGDGKTKEGRAVSHIFQIPGKYTVGLHVSEEHFASSDYLSVEVIPNKIYIKNVIVGEGGFIQLVNPDSSIIDIGGWIIEDFRKESFTIPAKTIIGAKSEIAFANDTTRLFKNRIEYPIIIRYSNLREAFQYSSSDETIKKIASEKIEPIQKTDQILPNINIYAEDYFPENKMQEGSEIEKHDSVNTEISQNLKKEDLAQVLNEDSFDLDLFFWVAFAVSIVSGIGYFVIKNFYF